VNALPGVLCSIRGRQVKTGMTLDSSHCHSAEIAKRLRRSSDKVVCGGSIPSLGTMSVKLKG
jgi:hypothetical protein